MPLQTWINRLSDGPVTKVMGFLAALMGFAVLAILYDLHALPGFTSQEAMESAQLARNMAQGNGYTTQALRPIDLALLKKQQPAELSKDLAQPGLRIPDVHTPPLYPMLQAAVFKVFAFHAPVGHMPSTRYLEYWIIGLNQALLFCATVILFLIARSLFDGAVASMSVALFVATDLFWQFTLAGLSTPLLILIFLGIVWCLTRLLKRNDPESAMPPGGLRMGLFLGALIAGAALTRYSFVFLLLPVLFLIGTSLEKQKIKVMLGVILAFSLVMAPWLVRNYTLTGNLFGSASYAIFQQTIPFPDDTLERSLDVTPGLNRMQSQFYVDKFMTNAQEILENDIPRLGGNWLALFFFVGILIPYRAKHLTKLRFFLLGSLILGVMVEAMGKTHVSTDMPAINTENLLVAMAPLAFVFGVSLFYSLLETLIGETNESRTLFVGVFGAVMSLPFLLVFLMPPNYPENNPSEPYYIQRVSAWMEEDELMSSDVPAAVAWHGEQACAWLPVNDADRFQEFSAYKPIKGIFLTSKTLNNQITQRALKANSWERFALDAWTRGEVPDHFPLSSSPNGLLPERFFISDHERWRTGEK